MSKKVFVVSAIIVGLLIGGMVIISLRKNQVNTTVGSPMGETKTTETTLAKLKKWDDPSGFTFQYPEDIAVNKHDEDTKNYAHVELTHSAHPGRLIVWAKDTTAADIAAWIKTDKLFATGSILDSTLGGEPAKKVLLTAPSDRQVVGTLYDGLLFYVDAMLEDKDYWTRVFDAVVDSYTFVPLVDEPISAGGSDFAVSEEYVDEEEIVE